MGEGENIVGEEESQVQIPAPALAICVPLIRQWMLVDPVLSFCLNPNPKAKHVKAIKPKRKSLCVCAGWLVRA
jgi:hypothetical protein